MDPSCPRCKSKLESIEHIIFRCEFAAKVWKHFPVVNSIEFKCISSALCWSDDWINNGGLHLSLIICLGWSLWKASNAFLFEAEIGKPLMVMNYVKALLADIKKSFSTPPVHS